MVMNLGRVILGGLVAGLVMNVGEFVLNGVILHNAMVEWGTKHNLPPEPNATFFVIAIGLTFMLGIVMIAAYALIRSRVGPGPRTAIIAALLMWFGIYFYSGVINGIILKIPTNELAIGIAWGLVEYAVAAIAGAWLYKEA
jgi:hypothetical protein